MRGAKNNSDTSEKLVYVGRCTKVVGGGRRFSFSVMVVAGFNLTLAEPNLNSIS